MVGFKALNYCLRIGSEENHDEQHSQDVLSLSLLLKLVCTKYRAGLHTNYIIKFNAYFSCEVTKFLNLTTIVLELNIQLINT